MAASELEMSMQHCRQLLTYIHVSSYCTCALVLQAGGSGWSAGLGSNLGWALSSFGASKAKGQPYDRCISVLLMHLLLHGIEDVSQGFSWQCPGVY